MKTYKIIILFLTCLIIPAGVYLIIVNFSTIKNYLRNSNTPVFSTLKNSSEEYKLINSVLEKVYPQYNYHIAYHASHPNKYFAYSINIQYDYLDLNSSTNVEIFYDHDALSGEFVDLGKAICGNSMIRDTFKIDAVNFTVMNGNKVPQYMYDDQWVCEN